jgi:hypothetical protein
LAIFSLFCLTFSTLCGIELTAYIDGKSCDGKERLEFLKAINPGFFCIARGAYCFSSHAQGESGNAQYNGALFCESEK